jgi:hypothetical protein
MLYMQDKKDLTEKNLTAVGLRLLTLFTLA